MLLDSSQIPIRIKSLTIYGNVGRTKENGELQLDFCISLLRFHCGQVFYKKKPLILCKLLKFKTEIQSTSDNKKIRHIFCDCSIFVFSKYKDSCLSYGSFCRLFFRVSQIRIILCSDNYYPVTLQS